MNNAFSKAAIWVVIALVLFTVFRQFDTRQGRAGDQDNDGQQEQAPSDEAHRAVQQSIE